MSAVLRFVEAGLGHAVVPEMVLTTRPQLHTTVLDDPPLDRVIALAHRSSEALPLAARAFKAALLAHLTAYGDGDLDPV
jgi:DNA-binding transcriptional LysR family regulator